MLIAALIGIVFGGLIGGLLIWLVGRFDLGLEVDGFASAFIAAIVIAAISWVITWLLGLVGITLGGGFLGAIINLLVAAAVLLLAGNMLPGLRVRGYGGAVTASVAMAVIAWLASLVVGLFT
jgi:uncharacterized membrane protein YvlD (DUF360 family)